MRPSFRPVLRGMASAMLGAVLATQPLFAADEPVVAETANMSVEVGTRLNEVIVLMNGQQLDAAAAALQGIRDTMQGSMNDYEEFQMLQLSGRLNSTLQKNPEAIADYEAILQLGSLADDARLAAANSAAELYLQTGDLNKGVERLLQVSELEGGQNRETLSRIAFAYLQLGQAATGVPYMEQALVVGGAEAGEADYRDMATLYIEAGNRVKAIETYEKLLEATPELADREAISANLAALYIQVGNKAKAMSALRALIRQYPTSDQLGTYQQSLSAVNGN
jgi:tetratricopeptide (TPR) repeat protein